MNSIVIRYADTVFRILRISSPLTVALIASDIQA